MLNEQDIQAIGVLLDQKLKVQSEQLTKDITENVLIKVDEKFDEVLQVMNEGFNGVQIQLDELKEDVGQLKEDVSQLKEDVSQLKEDVGQLKEDVSQLKEDVSKRPTRNEVFSWADRRIVDLEIGKERHDYLHIDELDGLPSPSEINRTLVERGFKQKLA